MGKWGDNIEMDLRKKIVSELKGTCVFSAGVLVGPSYSIWHTWDYAQNPTQSFINLFPELSSLYERYLSRTAWNQSLSVYRKVSGTADGVNRPFSHHRNHSGR